jgi:hypothetical protein
LNTAPAVFEKDSRRSVSMLQIRVSTNFIERSGPVVTARTLVAVSMHPFELVVISVIVFVPVVGYVYSGF